MEIWPLYYMHFWFNYFFLEYYTTSYYQIAFAAQTGFIECGQTTYISREDTSIYKIQSPNYPRAYDSSLKCSWEFILAFPDPVGYVGSSALDSVSLQITFPEPIFVKDYLNCSWDAIEVRYRSILSNFTHQFLTKLKFSDLFMRLAVKVTSFRKFNNILNLKPLYKDWLNVFLLTLSKS